MTFLEAVLLMCGVVLALTGICITVIRWEKQYPSKEFDERQKQARGNAYRLSFWIGLVYHFCLALAVLWVFPKALRPGNVFPFLFFGLIIQAITFHIYCIFTHAALPVAGNPKFTIWLYTALGVSNLLRFVTGRSDSEIAVLEPGPNNLTGLVTGFLFLVLAIVHLIQLLKNRQEDA